MRPSSAATGTRAGPLQIDTDPKGRPMPPRLTAVLLATTLLAATAAYADDATSPNQPAASANPPVATPSTSSAIVEPQLTTATVKLTGGWRASRLIGTAVYDDQSQKIGTVDDLIMTGTDKIGLAVLSVGGFIGIGSKLVAVPYGQLRYDPSAANPKVVMPGATKDTLNAMPGFTYNNG